MHSILVLNGPNLNLLGNREPHVYGAKTLGDVESECTAFAVSLSLDLVFRQSNREYELIDWIHDARGVVSAILINPGAFGHSSIAIFDALNAFDGPVVEVHISNIHKRESFRRHSFVSHRAEGVIVGCGTNGYILGLKHLATLLTSAPKN